MNQSKLNEKKINKIEIQLDRLEERYVFEEINKSQYNKFKQKLEQEKEELLKEYDKSGFDLSNLEKAVDKALNYSFKLSDMWVCGNLEQKRKLQKMVFPEGIDYDHENDVYRTFRVNVIFELIRSLSTENKDKKKGFSQFEPKKSHLVERASLMSNLLIADVLLILSK